MRLGSPTPLPIPAEIDARLVPHRQRYNAIDLDAVRVPPMILAPGSFLGEAYQIRAGEMMMVADLSARRMRLKKLSALLLWMPSPRLYAS